MMRNATLLAAFLLLATSVVAQVEKTFFQTFNIADGTRHIHIETPDSFELRSWNGVQLMVETIVRLDGGTMDLLGFVIKDGRFSLDETNDSGNLNFKAHQPKRMLLKNQGTVCREKIKILMYVPEEFDVNSRTDFVRKETLLAVQKN